ncbi:MAG: C_GCAxxG_C_C family protein [Deltaproteobacteria bacterium]|nr:C_GCAxxG_C_C family protein [Deltaproteobacteria bacterium]MBW1794536.1 C_GCAxxG_C_C family protein [Deltaproteobacteria bacterium]MBW2330720.1 C_GCAxxG_C_C family protein [Deltaproteobacteria bacterium]
MNGAASGLMEALATAQTGTDWDQIPYGGTSWFKYGSGGISCWGTLCGVPNGCCVVLNMINLHAKASNVLGYYSETEFPTSAVSDLYEAGGWTLPTGVPAPILDVNVLAKTVSNSPLCHVSISKWCATAGVSLGSTDELGRKYKNDRCGKICADMAAFTAELINGSAYAYTVPEDTAACMACHTTGSIEAPAQCGKMDCAGCHTGEAVIVSSRHPRHYGDDPHGGPGGDHCPK